jgi:methylase of polypeptide subunit release factors
MKSARTPLQRYNNPRRAVWPAADVVVGNPPFIGASTMRAALGDGYVDALRSAWGDVPESADFVMFWWHHAADLVAQGENFALWFHHHQQLAPNLQPPHRASRAG